MRKNYSELWGSTFFGQIPSFRDTKLQLYITLDINFTADSGSCENVISNLAVGKSSLFVVSMDNFNLFLDRRWKYDIDMHHAYRYNNYSFVFHDKKVVPVRIQFLPHEFADVLPESLPPDPPQLRENFYDHVAECVLLPGSYYWPSLRKIRGRIFSFPERMMWEILKCWISACEYSISCRNGNLRKSHSKL